MKMAKSLDAEMAAIEAKARSNGRTGLLPRAAILLSAGERRSRLGGIKQKKGRASR